MKRIFFLRHGKSDWNGPWSTDHERPLAPRGIRAAGRVGEFLSEIGQSPELVLTSTAVRAHTTAELAVRAQESAGNERIPIVATDRLYEASVSDVVELLRQQDDDLKSLLIAGHEPTSSNAVSVLTGGSLIKFPTAALARLDLPESSWSAVGPASCRLAWLVTPKLLKAFERG